MRSDRDTLDSAGEVGRPPVLFCCLLLVVRGSFLRPYGRIVGAVPKGGPLRINGDIHNRSMRHGFTNCDRRPAACEWRFLRTAFRGIPTTGRLATAVRFGNRPAPLVGRHLTGQKGLGQPLRTRPLAVIFLRSAICDRRTAFIS